MIRSQAENVGVGMCLFDTELRYLQINPYLAAINGLSVEAHLGRTISEVIPDVAARVEPLLRGVMKTGKPVIDGFVFAETAASPQKKRVFQHSYHVVRSGEGVVVGVRCIVQEIT
ncbi:MAG: PAS domain-containing protein [Phycisphaerales bacterium]